jgi:hypothetical protein
MNFLSTGDWLASGNDKERLLLEDPNNVTKKKDSDIDVQTARGRASDSQRSDNTGHTYPEPRHRVYSGAVNKLGLGCPAEDSGRTPQRLNYETH